jgi:hypothetical protein
MLMIRYIKHKEIDYKKWDACIDNALNGNIYTYSWYLDTVCERWDALIEGDYEALMPLPFRKKMGVNYIFPPTMTQQLGICSLETITENKILEFISCIPAKFKYCELNLNQYNHIQTDKLKITTHTNLELDLNPSYLNLIRAFSENTRRNIRKASVLNLQIQKNGNISNLIKLFKDSKAPEIKTLPGDFYAVVEKISQQLLLRNQAQIWEVKIDNELSAGVMFVFGHNKAYFLFSAANKLAKENNLMHFIVNTFIEENSGKNLLLDFEGSDNKNLARFYKSFGATEKNYKKIIVNRLPGALVSLIRKIHKK